MAPLGALMEFSHGINLLVFMRFDVGDGTRVRCWHGDSSFLEKYPELF